MATLLTAQNLSKTYAAHTLFTDVSLGLWEGDRLALIGPNGSGKSTLLKMFAGLETPDTGEITRRKQLRITYVAQQDSFPPDATPLSVVVDRMKDNVAAHGLDRETRAAITLSKLGFDDLEQPIGTLSGGWQKRVSIACALADEPNVLLLDEPTNHLDLEGVLWLEKFVKQASQAVVFVTHDRTFLESVAKRVIELSQAYPSGTFEVKGNYTEFVRRQEEYLDAQQTQRNALASKVRRDTAWLKQGIQGRQTRNKSQIADSIKNRANLNTVKDRIAAPKRTTDIDFQATERKTKNLLTAHNVSKAMGGRVLFEKLDLTLSPGLRLGLMGSNGSGKTTLLRLLSNQLKPDTGTIKQAADLRIVNFTQHRDTLVASESLRDALCPVGDVVHYRGKEIHVAGWARKFLFDPSKFNTSVGDLSGGEQARILIANLMLQPADVLILDEPTNDLDIASLEVLEQALMEFPGAMVLVTHDRFMLQRLATELISLEADGPPKRYYSYEQWEDDHTRDASNSKQSKAGVKAKPGAGSGAEKIVKKLSYKLQRELDMMEQTILEAEAQVETFEQDVNDPQVIADHARHAAVCQKLGQAHTRVEQLYGRWTELETLQQV